MRPVPSRISGRTTAVTLVGGLTVAATGFLLGVGYSMAALDGTDSAAGGDGWARLSAIQMRRSEEVERAAESRHGELMRALRALQDRRGSEQGSQSALGAPGVGAAPVVTSARTAASGAIPADRSARLAVFDGWPSDEALRTQWTGAEPAALRQWFGAADSVSTTENGATWRYRRTLADGTTRTTAVRIADGVVVAVATE